MCFTILARLAVALAVLALGGTRASACGFWFFCDARDYPPMYAPAQDGRVGPVWSSNGWSYPQHYGYVERLPYLPCEGQLQGRGLGDCRPVRLPTEPMRTQPMK
jgi:hypothetical protein